VILDDGTDTGAADVRASPVEGRHNQNLRGETGQRDAAANVKQAAVLAANRAKGAAKGAAAAALGASAILLP
jgi:hypothetical protein